MFGPGMTTLGWVVGIFLSLVMAALFLLLFSCLASLIYLAFLIEMLLLVPIVAIAHALLR